MSLTVLTDEQVRLMLENLSLQQLDGFRASLSGALYEYSNNAASIEDGTYQQPSRIHVYNAKTAATTLFMPSICPTGIGVKVVTLTSPQHTGKKEGIAAAPVIRPTGAITLLASDGRPMGFLHASTLTAFRTALSSSCLLARRRNIKVVTAFGSGLQAYWHIRLALMMQGGTIREVNIINRSFSANAKDILEKFLSIPSDIKAKEGWADALFSILTPSHKDFDRLLKKHVQDSDVLFCCTPSTEDLFSASILTSREARQKGRLIVAVGSYSPDMRELPKELLHQATGKQHSNGHDHLANNALDGGVIVVDTLEGVMKEAGEIIEAKIKPTQLVEFAIPMFLGGKHILTVCRLGELVKLPKPQEDDESDTSKTLSPAEFEGLDLRSRSDPNSRSPTNARLARPHLARPHFSRALSHGVLDQQKKKDSAQALWLRDGNVIYKSVGLGLMDLVVGTHMVKVAGDMGIGTRIDGF